MKKTLSRRRFLFLGSAGFASGVAGLHVTNNMGMRFIGDRLAELVKPSIEARHKPDPAGWDANRITASWLGHATVLINFYGLNIITDPVLFSRVGANFGLGTLGPLRRQACALQAQELPKIDLVLLSHAHFDHFDTPSLNVLPGTPQVVSAKNTADLFPGTRLTRAHELSWGQRQTINTDQGDVQVEAFEVKHWGARWRHDTHRGYNGYIVSRGGKKLIFAGDTAYSETFQDLRSKGPFELALMPIGAYSPWILNHCNPEQAWKMTLDSGAKHILPIHHFTFRLGRERCTEPLERLQTAMKGETDRLALKEAGETVVLQA